MALPQGVTDYLNENASNNGANAPSAGDDLFKAGILDSFADQRHTVAQLLERTPWRGRSVAIAAVSTRRLGI